jgi:topoisomerase-4 subunit A
VKSENSRIVFLDISATEKEMPKSLHVSLDGRSGARVREIDFDLAPVPVSTRTSKGLTITKWSIKEIKAAKPVSLELEQKAPKRGQAAESAKGAKESGTKKRGK